MDHDEVMNRVRAALGKLIDSDAHLLSVDVNERSITHRLGAYLQCQFEGWHVDCEYNRNRADAKYLEGWETNDTHARTVFPDIIVHHRDTADNLLVVEVKKTTNSTPNDSDLRKLRGCMEELGYRYALFLRLRTKCDRANVGVAQIVEIDDNGDPHELDW
jgi:hypothetical protein